VGPVLTDFCGERTHGGGVFVHDQDFSASDVGEVAECLDATAVDMTVWWAASAVIHAEGDVAKAGAGLQMARDWRVGRRMWQVEDVNSISEETDAVAHADDDCVPASNILVAEASRKVPRACITFAPELEPGGSQANLPCDSLLRANGLRRWFVQGPSSTPSLAWRTPKSQSLAGQ
jgi:hypothetical protein